MQAVFEVLRSPETTQLAPLIIDTPNGISALETRAKSFFTIRDSSSLSPDEKMGVSIVETYNFAEDTHPAYLDECTRLFKANSTKLKELDTKISIGLVVAVVGSSLSFLPFVGFFSVLGWGAVAYYGSQRGVAYKEYHDSLNLLVASCNWSLGGANDTVDRSVTTNPVIQSMMTALYPVLTKQDVANLIADDIEGAFLEMQRKCDLSRPSFFSRKEETSPEDKLALSKAESKFNHAFYGFNKGTASDFLDALLAIVPDLYRACANACSQAHEQYFPAQKCE